MMDSKPIIGNWRCIGKWWTWSEVISQGFLCRLTIVLVQTNVGVSSDHLLILSLIVSQLLVVGNVLVGDAPDQRWFVRDFLVIGTTHWTMYSGHQKVKCWHNFESALFVWLLSCLFFFFHSLLDCSLCMKCQKNKFMTLLVFAAKIPIWLPWWNWGL